MVYGFNTANGQIPLSATVPVTLSLALAPAAGIGYFIIFLAMQPLAYAHLKARIKQLLCCRCGGVSQSTDALLGLAASVEMLRVNQMSEDELISTISREYESRKQSQELFSSNYLRSTMKTQDF